MCGFAGVIAWDERYRVSRETLAKMSAAIAHRGPDGEGMYFSPDGPITPGTPQVALAHRRLAIIDPDPRANQPFTDGRGRWLVYNGEIYNYRELKRELKQLKPDYEWRTDCDTEVLLVAYDVWGEKCVEHFNGMFAFAIWDGVKKELFLARDRMGQKPLYLRQVDNALYFASELAAVPHDCRPSTHPIWWGDYLRYGCLAGTTPWIDTARLAPGETLLIHGSSSSTRNNYFRAAWLDSPQIDDDSARETTRSLVGKAVERQLISDVPLGVFLSGGIDSSVIAAASRKLGPVSTFSIRFNDPRYDESKFAREVAKHLGTEHHEFTVDANATASLLELTKVFGEPFADSSAIPTHYLSRETRKHVKVAVSGDGGDELFGGYDRYRAMKWGTQFRRFHFLKHAGVRLQRGHPKRFSTRVGRFLWTLGSKPAKRYDSYLRIFDEPTLCSLAPDAQLMFPLAEEAFSINFEGDRDPIKAALACDRMRYLPDDLLTKVDRASMLHALEVRSPFMDHELVQFAAGLTTDQLLKGGPKRMLREAFNDDLPAWVFKRKKMGFAVPIGEWFRGELRPMLHDHLFASDSFGSSHFNMSVVRRLVDEHESMRQDHSQRLYALLMLELWWKGQREGAP